MYLISVGENVEAVLVSVGMMSPPLTNAAKITQNTKIAAIYQFASDAIFF